MGAVLAAVFVAEIGDIAGFAKPVQLASWAELTPKHHEADTTVYRDGITKQGSGLDLAHILRAQPFEQGRGLDEVAEQKGDGPA